MLSCLLRMARADRGPEHDLPLAKEESAGDKTALSGCIEQYRIGPVEEPDHARWETEVAYLVDPRAR
jgi:hypothetical protein